jgi:hypothetical protein
VTARAAGRTAVIGSPREAESRRLRVRELLNVRLDEVALAAVRRLEEQIQKYERFRTPEPRTAAPPAGIPDDYPEHLP